MKLWANGLDPDFAHSERVASFALQLYDGLLACGMAACRRRRFRSLQPARRGSSARCWQVRRQKGHHKASFDLIRAHGNPLGWKPADLQRAAIVARFHRGTLPTRRHKSLRDLLPDEQKATIQLAAILRLANALDAAHDGHIRRIQIENVTSRIQIGEPIASA